MTNNYGLTFLVILLYTGWLKVVGHFGIVISKQLKFLKKEKYF